MPNPNQPNTLGILNAIVSQQQAIQVNNAAAYTLVKLGSLGDTINESPWCTVEMHRNTSSHYAAGGRVDEKPVVRITSGIPIMDPTGATQIDTSAVETTLISIRDAMVPQYQQHSTLGGVLNVYTLILVPDSEVWGYLRINGVWHRVFHVDLKISQQYQLATGVID